ncbi:MAG: cupin domain-containing protein [Pseudonocardia sp.]|nr:cupin domain-containing protein [Pseudonocardia sp.]
MQVRRVVTGRTADGKSVFVSDEQVAPVTPAALPGAEFHQLLWFDDTPQLPLDGAPQPYTTYFPPVNGFRWGFFTMPPESAGAADPADPEAARAEAAEKLPGLMDVFEPEHPGMHTTETVDVEVVLSGEITLELDDGAEVTLRQGDTVVQNGTRHAWHNRGSVPAVIAVGIVGARR